MLIQFYVNFIPIGNKFALIRRSVTTRGILAPVELIRDKAYSRRHIVRRYVHTYRSISDLERRWRYGAGLFSATKYWDRRSRKLGPDHKGATR